MTILLISSDSIDVKMAGPGIRYWEFANHLAKQHDVIVLMPNQSTLTHPKIQLIQQTRHTLLKALKQADVVVTQGFSYPLAPIVMMEKPLVVDLSFPLSVELLEHHAHLPLQEANLSHRYCVERTKMLLRRGDYFLYSHEALRDYWLGMLTAVNRLHPKQYRQDSNADRLFGCVPFGLPEEPPVQTRPVFKGDGAIFPQENISPETDTILLWGGGLWKWFDPRSLIRAMGEISATRQDIKLLFICGKRVDSKEKQTNVAYSTDEAIELSRKLGVYNRTVFFNTGWVPYGDRGSYFREVQIGVSTHYRNLETRFSFRTRILDYLWAELPIITTGGDALGELVEQEQLGVVVEPNSAWQLREAILKLADDHEFAAQCRENIRRVRQQFLWSRLMKPLDEFCASPYRTSRLTSFIKFCHLVKFYMTTAKILIQYRGYKKVLQKVKSKMQHEGGKCIHSSR
ncbi:glycosyltransferase [candidate division KSB3 bacterium]|uniref:Glycosyltransferase n=1 Tax=candidate division KSB3 bacterium TaxID=2044937 RepID=A0A2G6KCB9_9BACT|nr:MAG: glycosyltransferase [candidate division KSB3 bacterium]